MQAIILAAGMGRRLGDLTKDNTKCMIKVNGVTLIDRLLTQLSKLNLSRVVIVVGYKGKELIDFIGNRYKDIIRIEYTFNPVFDKTNNIYSLSLVKEQLQEEDTLLIESDLIFEDRLLDMILNNPNPNLALVAKYETWMDGTMVCINQECDIVNFVTKQAFNYANVESYYKTVNVYKFSKEFSVHRYVPFLNAYCEAVGNNEYYEQVLRVITLLGKTDMKALPIEDAKWYEIDDVQDLDIASTIFSDGTVKYHEYHKRYGGYWRFPNLLDYCYLVNPFFPTQRLKDEMKANFEILLTEYPSGMLVNSLLAGKYFGVNQNYICVGNGASELIKCVMEQHIKNKVGLVYPTFEEYPNRLKKEQIVPFISKDADFRYSAVDLEQFYNDKEISLLLLINPDNPSGNFIPKADLLHLADWAKEKNIDLIVDESFVDFSDDFATTSLLDNNILHSYPNLLVMKSISKSYGVPGLRLGIFASSNEELINKIKKEVSIWNINSFAEFYLQIFGKYENDYKKACEQFLPVRKKLYEELKRIPYLRVIPSQANYFLCEIIDKYSSTELTLKLIQKDILVSNCSLKSYLHDKNYIRLAIRSEKDNTKLINILKSL